MIITPLRSAKLISQQLRQIEACHTHHGHGKGVKDKHKRTLLDYSKQFNILKRKPRKSLIEKLKDFDFSLGERPLEQLVLTSIRIPPSLIDTTADHHGITANLFHMDSDLQIKTAFKEDFKAQFNMFDSRERIETILKILEKEIDFENFVQ